MMTEHNPQHSPPRWPKERIVVHSWDEVPQFANECEEHEFWSTHEMGDEFFDNVRPEDYADLPPPRPRRRAPRRQSAG
jgi:hypothetical protein